MCFVSGGFSQCGWEFCVTCGMFKRTRLGDNRAHQLWSYCKFPKQQRAGTNDYFFNLYYDQKYKSYSKAYPNKVPCHQIIPEVDIKFCLIQMDTFTVH